MAIQNADHDTEKLDLSYFADGVVNGAAMRENGLIVSLRTKHTLTIQSSHCTPGHLFQRNEHMFTQKPLHDSSWQFYL